MLRRIPGPSPQARLFFRSDWQPVAGLPTEHPVDQPAVTNPVELKLLATRGRWLDKVDLSKVDEIGFTDLLPGSGHGNGGYTDLGFLEVYGKPAPRAGAGQKAQQR